MKATGDNQSARRLRGRDTPMPPTPLQATPDEKASKPAEAPKAKFVDPMDEQPETPKDKAPDAELEQKPPVKADAKDQPPSKEQNLRLLATERDKFRTENDQLKKRLQEAEDRLKQTEDYPKVKETLAQREKRLEEIENRLRHTDYKSSEEYQNKWLKPMETAYKRTLNALKEFQVEIPGAPDDAGNPGKPSFRAATEEDFAQLYNMPEGTAWREARKMFGDAAPAIMQHRSSLKQIEEGARAAAEEYRTNGQKLEQEEMARRVSQQQETEKMWEAENTRLVEAMPKVLKERADDQEHNSVLESSRQLVDAAYSEARKAMEPKARVALDARVRSRAIAYGPLMLEVQRLRQQLQEEQQRTKALEDSDPGVPSSGRTQVETEPKDLREHFLQKTK